MTNYRVKRGLYVSTVMVMLVIILTNTTLIPTVRWMLLMALDRGGSEWIPLSDSGEPQERWMELARTKGISVSSSPIRWLASYDGYEVGEADILLDKENVDTLLFVRIDPQRTTFQVHVSPESYRDADEWSDALSARVVINGSYYNSAGYPDTPLRSFGIPFGPIQYAANHGAFVVQGEQPDVIDLQGKAWQSVLTGSSQAMVSYPLLLDNEGESRATGRDTLLANRSLVARTKKGQIILGTTERASLTLERLSHFLKTLPLDITTAVNLDGGPVASLAIRLPSLSKTVYGRWETQEHSGKEVGLRPGIAGKKWALPIVLAVLDRAPQRGREPGSRPS